MLRILLAALLGGLLLLSLALGWLLYAAQPDTRGLQPAQFADGDDGIVQTLAVDRSAPRPNIVIILADDLGYGDLSAQGSGVVRTPQIDALAADGMRFTDFYSAMPVCTPSRAGLLTGRYPTRSGMITAGQAHADTFVRRLVYQAGKVFSQLGVVDLRGGGNMVDGLPPSEITIAELLRRAGYATGAFGKWHLGDFTVLPEYHPMEHGFDAFTGFNMSNDDWPVAFWEGREELIEDIGLEQERYTRVFTEAAIEFMARPREEPFFVYLAQKDPHQPFYPSAPFKGKSDGGPYGDAVAEFDWSVGAVRGALERLGLADNTLLIVTSDNGPWYEGSSGGLRGRKGQTYEGGFRVPMVAYWPGVIAPGQVTGTPAMNIDFLPTAAALAGVALPPDRVVDGENIMPILEGGSIAERPLIYFDDYDAEGLRVGDWKLLVTHNHYTWPVPLDDPESFAGKVIGGRDYTPPEGGESVPTLGDWPALYQIRRDREEAYNLAEREPARQLELARQLDAWTRAFLDNPRGWR